MKMMRHISNLCFALALAGAAWALPVSAITGPAQPGSPAEPSLIMLSTERGFCTAIVLARDVLITAAHCVHHAKGAAVWSVGTSPSGLIEAKQIIIHPGFRPNAEKTRERSVDLAMLRLDRPLPTRFTPLSIDYDVQIETGAAFTMSGFGLAQENDGKTGGTLRSARLVTREPLSKLLIWAKDPDGRGLGACTGDSGGPFLSMDGRLVGITVWSQGMGNKACGDLTQALRLGPERNFIEKNLQQWSR